MRYLIKVPRVVYHYYFQKDGDLDIMVDTDFAGCRVTRRSTSGGVALRGGHCVRHWSSTQPTISLSSGEAELTGLTKGATHGIGLRSIAADLGIDLKITLTTDASAALGMSRRLGVGKARHLDTSLLWIQHEFRNGNLLVEKVPGQHNCADMLTK